MRLLITCAALALLSGCVVHPRPAPPAPSRPAPQAHRLEPVRPIAHPHTALDAPGAASVAREYAFRRGLTTEALNVHREADAWRVKLKAHGDYRGHLLVLVDAFTGQVSLLEDSVKPHDRGKGHGHSQHDSRTHYQGN